MAVKKRDEGRAALGVLLTAELTGAGPVQVIYPYLIEDFEAQSPVMAIASSSTAGLPFTFARLRPQFRYNILTYVTRTSDGAGIESSSEIVLDAVSDALFVVISENQKTADWQCLRYDETGSQIVPWVSQTGEIYWLEITRLIMEGY